MRYTCAFFWFTSVAALAQNDTIQLNEVSVSATRFEQAARRSPFQIQTITRQQIVFQN